jgi:uncharacterized zinc-type alcohol dehydrogenase-like protein
VSHSKHLTFNDTYKCGTRGIVSDVEVIDIKKVNEAYERVMTNDVRYRFVIDMKTL